MVRKEGEEGEGGGGGGGGGVVRKNVCVILGH